MRNPVCIAYINHQKDGPISKSQRCCPDILVVLGEVRVQQPRKEHGRHLLATLCLVPYITCGRLPWDTAAQIAPPCRNAPPRFLHSLGPLSPQLVCLALFLLIHNPGQHNTDYFATRESCESTAWILSGKIQYQDPAHSTRYGGTGYLYSLSYRYRVPVQLYQTISSSAPMSREIRHRPTFYTKNQYKRKCLLMRTEILLQPRRHSWCATS